MRGLKLEWLEKCIGNPRVARGAPNASFAVQNSFGGAMGSLGGGMLDHVQIHHLHPRDIIVVSTSRP